MQNGDAVRQRISRWWMRYQCARRGHPVTVYVALPGEADACMCGEMWYGYIARWPSTTPYNQADEFECLDPDCDCHQPWYDG
jgi:hypothetical protein